MSQSSSSSSSFSSGFSFIGFIGTVSAMFCSYTINHSFIWAIVHGMFGWFYMLYLCMGFGGGFDAPDQKFNELMGKTPITDPVSVQKTESNS